MGGLNLRAISATAADGWIALAIYGTSLLVATIQTTLLIEGLLGPGSDAMAGLRLQIIIWALVAAAWCYLAQERGQ